MSPFRFRTHAVWPSLPRLSRASTVGAAALALVFCGSSSASAGCSFSPDKTPAFGVPSQLWGELAPTDTGRLALTRDNTYFDQTGDFETNPYTMALDIEQGWIFVARNRRFEIWDARSVPGLPVRTTYLSFRSSGLTWTPDSHAFFLFNDVDVPPGDINIAAIAGAYGIGLAVFNIATKTEPPLLRYQDHGDGRLAEQVYAASFGGRNYAFVAASGSPIGGVYAYDLTAAAALSTACVEAQPGNTSSCPGVFLRQIGTRTRATYIDGAGTYVVVSSGLSPMGLEIWNMANPLNPQRVMNALTSERVYGVALWQQGGSYFLAANVSGQGRIYDVSCITGGLCSPSLVATRTVEGVGQKLPVTFSRSGDTPFVYFGTSNECLSGNQREWLFDVSNPSSPRDVMPPGTKVIGGAPVSYWGWYYWDNGVHGFNRTSPRMGKFFGNHFYRAAYSIFDIHRWQQAVDPGAIFADGFESGDLSAWSGVIVD